MTWQNSDGLTVKFAREEAAVGLGGEYVTFGPERITEFAIDWTDVLSATASILGSVGTVNGVGSDGILIPSGVRINRIDIVTETAPTSSGTVASADLTIGLIRQDKSTVYDVDGFTTSSLVIGTVLETAGEMVTVDTNTTGNGVLIGTTLANSGYIVVANSGHASHPYTAGKWKVRVYWYNDQSIG